MMAGKTEFILNSKKVTASGDASRPLLKSLREEFRLKSLKEGCGRGECGTCTVLLEGKPVASCMIMTGQVSGKKVYTLEGLLETEEMKLLIDCYANCGAVQCGFCTPGFLIVSYALLKQNPSPTRVQIRQAMAGNVCRCTGYTKIIDSVMEASAYLNDNETQKKGKK